MTDLDPVVLDVSGQAWAIRLREPFAFVPCEDSEDFLALQGKKHDERVELGDGPIQQVEGG